MVKCGACDYWMVTKDDPNWGECRRNAPVPQLANGAEYFITPGTHRVVWPLSRAVDGCGQGEVRTTKVSIPAQTDTPASMDPNSAFNKMVQSAKNRMRP